jgi:hypothetical protein
MINTPFVGRGVEASGEGTTWFHFLHALRQESFLQRCHLAGMLRISKMYVCVVLAVSTVGAVS